MEARPVPRTNRARKIALPGLIFLAANLSLGPVAAQQGSGPPKAIAKVQDSNGGSVGTMQVRQLPQGTVFVVELNNLPPGAHGFHIHEQGTCKPPDFESAGSHYAPLDNDHGYANPRGYHGGDLPNIHANANGWVRAEFFAHQLALREERGRQSGMGTDGSAFAPDAPGPFPLLDDDGSAVVVHENPDDYKAQPPDSTGKRIACGVIEPAGGGGQDGGGQGS